MHSAGGGSGTAGVTDGVTVGVIDAGVRDGPVRALTIFGLPADAEEEATLIVLQGTVARDMYGEVGAGPNEDLVEKVPGAEPTLSRAMLLAMLLAMPLAMLLAALANFKPVGVADRELSADVALGIAAAVRGPRHVVAPVGGGGAPVMVRRVLSIGVDMADAGHREDAVEPLSTPSICAAWPIPRAKASPWSCSRSSSFNDFSKSSRRRRTWRATSSATGGDIGDLSPEASVTARGFSKCRCSRRVGALGAIAPEHSPPGAVVPEAPAFLRGVRAGGVTRPSFAAAAARRDLGCETRFPSSRAWQASPCTLR